MRRVVIGSVLLMLSTASFATEYVKEVKLTHVGVQAERPVQSFTQNTEWINFAPGASWAVNGGSGGGACAESAAYLPPDNSKLLTIALAAIASGATVEVAVDNSLPLISGYCRVTMLFIKSS